MQTNQKHYCSNPTFSESEVLSIIKNLDYCNDNKDTILVVLKSIKNEEQILRLSSIANKRVFFKKILNLCLLQKCKRFILIKTTDFLITPKIKEEIRQDALILKEASHSIDLEFEGFILICTNCKT